MRMIGAMKTPRDGVCMVCMSRKNPCDIGLQGKQNNIGVWFTLCQECAQDLIETIKGVYSLDE